MIDPVDLDFGLFSAAPTVTLPLLTLKLCYASVASRRPNMSSSVLAKFAH